MPAGKPQKFIGFFKLIEAMNHPGCPVCRRMLDETHHAMESFLYESVNDPGLRAEIRRDKGLCHRHCWQLAGFGDALGGAILFQDILQSLLPAAAVSGDLTQQGAQLCHFCRAEEQVGRSVLAELAQRLDDEEVKAAWNGPAVLCIPHLAQTCASARKTKKGNARALQSLQETHQRKYTTLCEQMRLLLIKQSYDHRNEKPGPEKDSWLRAVEVLVGRAGIR